MKRHLGQAGFSIVEIVVASVILAIIVGSSLTFMSNTETRDTFRGKIQQDNTCLTEANKIISNLKERGQSRMRLNFPSNILNNGARPTKTFGVVLDQTYEGFFPWEPGIANSDRWPTTKPVYTTNLASDSNTIRPSLLIMGYMNALQGIYNSNSAICSNANGLSSYLDQLGANSIIIQPTSNFNQPSGAANPSAFLRIQPFNTQTGTVLACPSTVYVRPAGPREASLATNLYTPQPPGGGFPAIVNPTGNNIFLADSEFSHTTGFLVTARVNYVDRKGQPRSCSVQEKFQYNAQPENSLTLEIKDTGATATGGTWSAENINDTPVTAPAHDVLDINGTIKAVGVANPPDWSSAAGANAPASQFIGCGQTANHVRSVNFRMTRTRPGSIHMCRNLSSMRVAQDVSAGTGAYDYAQLNQLVNSGGSAYPDWGFMVRFSRGTFITFNSNELAAHPYFRARDATTNAVRNDLVMGGLYYPESTNISDGPNSVSGSFPNGTSSHSGYYCFSATGCGGGGTTADLIRRALPRSANGAGTWNSTAPANTRDFNTSIQNLAADGTRDWVPCESLTNVCDSASTLSTTRFVQGNSSTSALDAYHLRIDNLPSGCDVHIQIAEVDAGYNVKATEIREYIQEPQLGNKLCRKGFAGTLFTTGPPSHPDFRGKWFFACTGGSTPYAPAGTAPNCSDGVGNQDCCFDYPDYPQYLPSQ